jgi:hypothetical protein
MRADLNQIVAETLAVQSLDLDVVHPTDLGDGIRLVIADVSPAVLLDPFVPNLATALRRHRKTAAEAARLRLRVAITTGLLHRDAAGWAGAPLVECARLLDAGPVRQVLAADDRVDLVVVVSRAVYDGVVRHGYGLDPDSFHPVEIAEKETRATVWVHVPGYRVPPGLDDDVVAVKGARGPRVLPTVWNVPPRSAVFVGRDAMVVWLREQLGASACVADDREVVGAEVCGQLEWIVVDPRLVCHRRRVSVELVGDERDDVVFA